MKVANVHFLGLLELSQCQSIHTSYIRIGDKCIPAGFIKFIDYDYPSTPSENGDLSPTALANDAQVMMTFYQNPTTLKWNVDFVAREGQTTQDEKAKEQMSHWCQFMSEED